MRLVLALLVVVACQRTSPRRGVYDELEHRTPQVLEAIDRLAASLRATDGDCRRIAAALRGFGDRHAASIAELAELKRSLSADERDRFEHDHAEDADQLEPVLAAVRPCDGDPDVGAALETAGFRR